MKSFMMTTALALVASAASAGNLVTAGLDDPHVTPRIVALSFDGAYGGVMAGSQQTTTTYSEHTGYLRECSRGQGKWGGKCTVSLDDWNNSPELLALGEPVDGHPSNAGDLSENFRYDAGYPGVWVADEPIQFTSLSDADVLSNYGNNTVIGDVFTVLTSEEKTTTFGAYGGYRFAVTDMIYAGGELGYIRGDGEDDALTTLEGTASIAAGNTLFTGYAGFAQMGDEDGKSVGFGADMYFNSGMTVGVKAYEATFDVAVGSGEVKKATGVVARVGWSF